jgi:putative acetyltransferase
MKIRSEQPEDIDAVRQVNIDAFGSESEANLVDRLRGVASTLSFVAVESEQIIGHIFFSPVAIAGNFPDNVLILGLAPLAVISDRQRQGIGSLLIRHGLGECAKLNCKAVVVLGHPEYYPRFGFVPAKEKGFRCKYGVSDKSFMLLELENGALEGYGGMVEYRPEFDEFE